MSRPGHVVRAIGVIRLRQEHDSSLETKLDICQNSTNWMSGAATLSFMTADDQWRVLTCSMLNTYSPEGSKIIPGRSPALLPSTSWNAIVMWYASSSRIFSGTQKNKRLDSAGDKNCSRRDGISPVSCSVGRRHRWNYL